MPGPVGGGRVVEESRCGALKGHGQVTNGLRLLGECKLENRTLGPCVLSSGQRSLDAPFHIADQLLTDEHIHQALADPGFGRPSEPTGQSEELIEGLVVSAPKGPFVRQCCTGHPPSLVRRPENVCCRNSHVSQKNLIEMG